MIEKRLALHPAVRDVFVYGVPASNGAPGERDVVAAIVMTPDATAEPAALFDWCRAGLPRHMVPSYIQLTPEIPKTASEKPQQRFLEEAFRGQPGQVYGDRGASPPAAAT